MKVKIFINTNKKILVLVFILAVITVGVFAVNTAFRIGIGQFGKYSVVYLDTGDVYFGRLSYFPHMKLSDVHIALSVQGRQGSFESDTKLVPLESSIWGGGEILLNRDKIVFIGRIGDDSQVMKAINQSKINRSK